MENKTFTVIKFDATLDPKWFSLISSFTDPTFFISIYDTVLDKTYFRSDITEESIITDMVQENETVVAQGLPSRYIMHVNVETDSPAIAFQILTIFEDVVKAHTPVITYTYP